MRRVLIVLGILVLPVVLKGQDVRRAGRFGGGFVRATRSQMTHASMIGRSAAEFRYPLDPRLLSSSLPSGAEWPGMTPMAQEGAPRWLAVTVRCCSLIEQARASGWSSTIGWPLFSNGEGFTAIGG